MSIDQGLAEILTRYQESFTGKVYSEENEDHDLLMDVFGLSPQLKRENRQYWGRELGYCWQLLVIEAFKNHPAYAPALRIDADEPCDLIVGKYAIDTKYRIGSGDSGTLKKFKSSGPLLREEGYEPVFLILREDNLSAAIQACNIGTWSVLSGSQSLNFVKKYSGFDLEAFLKKSATNFPVNR